MKRIFAVSGAVAALASVAQAGDCGDPLFKDCSKPPPLPPTSNNLVSQSNIWRRSGYYMVNAFDYEEDYEDYTEKSGLAWRIPYVGYVNLTVIGSRFYQHAYYIQATTGVGGRDEGRAWYRELFGHSNRTDYEQGHAILLDERFEGTKEGLFEYPDGMAVQADYSRILDIGSSKSIRRTKARVPSADTGEVTILETLTCQEQTECMVLYFIEERFDEFGNRTTFSSGTYTKMSEDEWKKGITDNYNTLNIPAAQQKAVPNDCLVDAFCVTTKEICDSGDPFCREPEEEEDGELRKGAIASFVIFGFFFLVAGLFLLWIWFTMYNEKRFRTAFISRFSEDVSLQKAMKEISPENMTREFNFIDKDRKGYITKGELLNYLLTANLSKPIADRDFAKLWRTMDINGNGKVGYAEFCAFTADCYKEHSAMRSNLIVEAKKASSAPTM